MENRNGLIAQAMVTQADGYAEREAALLMLADQQGDRARRITMGADKAYDSADFVRRAGAERDPAHRQEQQRTPLQHGPQNDPARRACHQPKCRWLIEKSFGWLKQTGPVRQVKARGLHKVDWVFVFSCAAHNLLRLPRLIAQQPA